MPDEADAREALGVAGMLLDCITDSLQESGDLRPMRDLLGFALVFGGWIAYR